MTPEQFCYWMQGFCELNCEPPTKEQWQSIKDHLGIVFDKVTPETPFKVDMEAIAQTIKSSPRPSTPRKFC